MVHDPQAENHCTKPTIQLNQADDLMILHNFFAFGHSRFGHGTFGLGRFGLETFWSDYEIMQKSYMLTFYCKRA